MRFDRNRSRLELSNEQMKELVRMAAGDLDPSTCAQEWVDAGIVVDGEVHPVAGGMIAVALDAPRASSIRRFDGSDMAPLFVGIDQHGRATMTEAAGFGASDGAAAWITATRIELLPALLMQAVRLHAGIPSPEGREAFSITAAELDETLMRLSAGEGAPNEVRADSEECALDRLLQAFESGWEAAGGWQRQAADSFVTVLNAGVLGLWFVDTGRVEGGEMIDRNKASCLVPCTVAEATARLGDVVTGRHAARPGGANAGVV